jgi:hypothetical protein
MRLYRSVAYASAVIAGVWSCWHVSVRAAEPTALFHPDPRHVANQLYRQVHLRTEPSGKEYGLDTLDPLLWRETDYMLSGTSHARAVALVDEFLRNHAERQITDPAKRAILQRDLWAVFDWADQADLPHQTERRELMAKLAQVIRRLALSPDELASLPDSYGRALQNHEFPSAYDPTRPNQAFLPTDLFETRGPWVCLGVPGHDLAAPLHDSSFTTRSVFLVFARLPGGRDATLAYFKRLSDMKIPLFVQMKDPGWPQPMEVWNPRVPQFSVGTEFALVRKLVLPDRDGHPRVTPVTESVQIRHYTDIPSVNPMASRDVNLARRFQEPSEIELSRVLFFSAHHSGLRGVTASDDPFLIFPVMSHGDDPFEGRHMPVRAGSPFVECTSCHLGPGIQSMMSFSFRGNPNEGTALNPRLVETTPDEEAEKVMEWGQRQEKWKDFLRLWSSASPN